MSGSESVASESTNTTDCADGTAECAGYDESGAGEDEAVQKARYRNQSPGRWRSESAQNQSRQTSYVKKTKNTMRNPLKLHTHTYIDIYTCVNWAKSMGRSFIKCV